ncbi:MAG: putative threonylcarbamoyl-AMP synthase [Acidimicrobiales bacterium]|jgi:L-threonylcarbamoyladenylate synthase|nr:putative threonylcarbamoyl-AMP synthase [Acidimicrobiales bacterium]
MPVMPATSLDEAAAALSAGHPIGIPTDTVYGLAALVGEPGATDRIFAAKARSRDVALPVLVADAAQARALATALTECASTLMSSFWPGALTLVVPRDPGLQADLGDDEMTVGVRCPDHPVPLALCRRLGPLATTSANRHGEPTPATAAGVAEVFGDAVPLVLDAGRCDGSPSTVVDCTGVEPKLLREGRIPWAVVLAALS